MTHETIIPAIKEGSGLPPELPFSQALHGKTRAHTAIQPLPL